MNSENMLLALLLVYTEYYDRMPIENIFANFSNRAIFEEMHKQKKFNYITLKEHLTSLEVLTQLEYLYKLDFKVSDFEAYREAVLFEHIKTRTADYARRLSSGNYNNIDDAKADLAEINSLYERTSNAVITPIREIIKEVAQEEADNVQDETTDSYVAYIDKQTKYEQDMLVIIGARPSIGKAQSLDSLIVTPTGYKRMGDIKINDYVIGQDGKKARVSGIFPQGKKDMYRVYFNDRTYTECCKDHLWNVNSRRDRKANRKNFTTVALKDLKDIKLSMNRKNYIIPMTKPVEFEEKELFIHPYVMGALLGNGCLVESTFTFSSGCKETLSNFNKLLNKDIELVKYSKYDYRIIDNISRGKNRFVDVIKKLELYGCHSYDKFIPDVYKINSVEIRKDLLAGLLDTDGTISKGTSITYTTVSKRLAEDVQFIIQSLGGWATINQRYTYYTHNGEKKRGRLSYRLYIRLPDGYNPFKIKRKADRVKNKKRVPPVRYIEKIEKVGKKECQCIYVENDNHLYLTDNFIVTHNTSVILNMIAQDIKNKVPILFFSAETNKKKMTKALACILAGVNQFDYKHGTLTNQERCQVHDAYDMIYQSKVWIDDSSRIDIAQIERRTREHERDYGIRKVYIDYLQYINNSNPRCTTVRDQITDISKRLKGIARENNIPVIAAAQLNRTAVGGEDKEPDISHLKESGGIEQDADIIILLHGMKKELGGGAIETLMMKYGKYRDGMQGKVYTAFNKATKRINLNAE